jgi:hypothetical protein
VAGEGRDDIGWNLTPEEIAIRDKRQALAELEREAELAPEDPKAKRADGGSGRFSAPLSPSISLDRPSEL